MVVTKIDQLSLKYIKVKGEGKAELIMAKVDIEIGTDQRVEIDIVHHHTEVDFSMDILQRKVSVYSKLQRKF